MRSNYAPHIHSLAHEHSPSRRYHRVRASPGSNGRAGNQQRDLPPCARRFQQRLGQQSQGIFFTARTPSRNSCFPTANIGSGFTISSRAMAFRYSASGSTSACARASSSNGLASRSAAVFNRRTTRAPIRVLQRKRAGAPRELLDDPFAPSAAAIQKAPDRSPRSNVVFSQSGSWLPHLAKPQGPDSWRPCRSP
jgi:hypothetical protein